MIELFDSFAGFKLLKLFLFNPRTSYNINEVAKNTSLSVFPSKKYCDYFLKEGLLEVNKVGNQRRFALNDKSVYAKELKKSVALLWFKDLGIENLASLGTISMAVYGSFASGEFDEQSDLDLLILGMKDDIDRQKLSKFGEEIKREVQLTYYSWEKWAKMKKEKHEFVEAILNKHILVRGTKL